MAAKNLKIKATVNAEDKASTKIGRIAARIKGSIGKIGKFAKKAALGVGVLGVAVAAAAFKVFKWVDNYASATDELSKFSRAIGFSIETLQELRFAAERTGVGANLLQMSLEKLNKNLGDTKAGTGSLTTLLKKVDPGLLKVLKGVKGTEEAFGILIEKMRKLKDPMRRASLASAAFGKGGLKIIRFLDEGVGGFKALRAQARQYGLVTTEGGKRAEAFGDSMANLKQAIRGVKRTIGDQLLPVFRPLIESMTKWIAANRVMIGQKVAGVIKTAVGAAKDLWGWWGKNKKAIFTFAGASVEALKAILAPLGKIITLMGLMGEANDVEEKNAKLRAKLQTQRDKESVRRAAGLNALETGKEFLRGKFSPKVVAQILAQREVARKLAPAPRATTQQQLGAGPGRFQLPGLRAVQQELKAGITVDFQNVPKGVEVGTPTTSGKNLTVKSNVGRSPAGN